MSYYAVGLVVPAGKVLSTLTDFVTKVDLSHAPAAWWAQVAAGGSDIRVKQGGVDCPIDLVTINVGASTGFLYFKHTLTTSANVFTLECGTGAAAPAVTDPIGRNAVWSSVFHCVLSTYDATLTDRTGNNGAATITGGTISGGKFTLTGVSGQGAWIDTSAAPSSIWCTGSGADRADAGQRNVVDMSSSTGVNRAILAFRGSTSYALWNSTDDWMNSGDSNGAPIRLVGTHNGTTNRKIYTSGVLRNTDTTIAARNEVRMWIGRRWDADASATWNGDLYGPIYKRHSIPTDDWVSAENESWESPATFYTIVGAAWAGGSLTLSGTGSASGSVPGSGSGSLSLSGAGVSTAPLAGAGSLLLGGSGGVVVAVGGAGSLTLSATGEASAFHYPAPDIACCEPAMTRRRAA